MMFAKSLSFVFVLSLSLQALGHALIEPAIGVSGAGARSDVQRPSTKKPCGNVNVATALKSSTPVKATNGAFTVTVQNFNAGQDGSTQINSAVVDTTGTGSSFAGKATITKNGVLAPQSVGSVKVSGTLPAGTKCTGGADGASCLVSFTTAGGFGNCVLVSTGGGAAAGNGTAAKGGKKSNKSKKDCSSTAAGTRKAREVKAREEAGELVARDDQAWIWAA